MDIKWLLEALRSKPDAPGVYRTPGYPVRRQNPGLFDSIKSVNKDVNYARYKKLQSDIGDTPVSYEEWLRDQ